MTAQEPERHLCRDCPDCGCQPGCDLACWWDCGCPAVDATRPDLSGETLETLRPRMGAAELMSFPGRIKIYIEPCDMWIGAYFAPDAIYICPVPFLVIRWAR